MESEIFDFVTKYGVSGFAIIACVFMWRKLDAAMDGMGARIRELEGQIWGKLIGLVEGDMESRKNHTAVLRSLASAIEKAECGKGKNLSGDITPL